MTGVIHLAYSLDLIWEADGIHERFEPERILCLERNESVQGRVRRRNGEFQHSMAAYGL
jgi:hypothetical protein